MDTNIIPSPTINKNSIFTIRPYKYYGSWVFDDKRVGLDKEAFVAGADSLLDILSDGRDSVIVQFSDKPFPDYQMGLTLLKTGSSGSDYITEINDLPHQLWLCPALFLYYNPAPQNIYLRILKNN